MARIWYRFFLAFFIVKYSYICSGKIIGQNHGITSVPVFSPIRPYAFVGRDRKKQQETSTPPTFKQFTVNKEKIISKLLTERNAKLVLVAGGTAAFGVTVYKFVSRVIRYWLYDRYFTKDAPRVTELIGHVLIENTPVLPTKTFMEKVFDPVSKALGRIPLVKGLLKPGMRRIKTASVIDKDTVVGLYFNDYYVSQQSMNQAHFEKRYFQEILGHLKTAGKKLVIVEVGTPSRDRTYEAFKGLPWYCMPTSTWKQKAVNLYYRFRVGRRQHLVLLDSEGNVINENASSYLLCRPNDYPWHPLRPFDTLPEKLMNSEGDFVNKSTLEGKLVLLYFNFKLRDQDMMTTKIKKFWERMKTEKNEELEVVVIHHDKEEANSQKLLTYPKEWLHVVSTEPVEVSLFYNTTNPEYDLAVLLDRDGRVYTTLGYLLVDENYHELIMNDYPKGALRVKDLRKSVESSKRCGMIVVIADPDDPKENERLKTEMNKALLSHENKRRGYKFDFWLFEDTTTADNLKKQFKLPKDLKMFAYDTISNSQKFSTEKVTEESILKLIDDQYNSL